METVEVPEVQDIETDDQTTDPTGPVPRVLVRDREAASMLGISVAHFRAMVSSGVVDVDPVRLGRAVRYSVASLQAWAKAGCPHRRLRGRV